MQLYNYRNTLNILSTARDIEERFEHTKEFTEEELIASDLKNEY